MAFLFVFFNIAWGLGLQYQLTSGGNSKYDVSPNIDWLDGWTYIHPLIIYIMYGCGDSMVQVCVLLSFIISPGSNRCLPTGL